MTKPLTVRHSDARAKFDAARIALEVAAADILKPPPPGKGPEWRPNDVNAAAALFAVAVANLGLWYRKHGFEPKFEFAHLFPELRKEGV
jgi:hypothetical protein